MDKQVKMLMGYIFGFLIGFGLAVTGGISLIAYLNFLPAGLSWSDYFIFVVTRPECYFLPIGLVIMAMVLSRFPNHP